MTALQDKLRDKAFSKISNITVKIRDIENDKKYNLSILEDEQLDLMIRGAKRDLELWNYIAELVEKDI
jgi:hypothetical protein